VPTLTKYRNGVRFHEKNDLYLESVPLCEELQPRRSKYGRCPFRLRTVMGRRTSDVRPVKNGHSCERRLSRQIRSFPWPGGL
jgi:hypothetical protein